MLQNGWIMDSEVLPLFPTFVWKTQLARDPQQPINDRIGRALKAMAPELEYGQAWQSQHGLHELEEFAELFEYVIDATSTVLEFLKMN